MNIPDFESSTRISVMKSELEWLENHRRILDGLLITASFRIELLKKLIREEQVKK